MVQYAGYLNSVGIINIDPFDLENLDLSRVSLILRYVDSTRVGNTEAVAPAQN